MLVFNKLKLIRKAVFVVLLALVLSNATSLPYFPISAEADTGHHSKAKNDGTGVGEGSVLDKKHKYTRATHYTIKSNNNPAPSYCNCVIFRLDDVQDYWISSLQTTVMDQFIQKNQSLSVGPILDYIGDDASIVNKVNEGASKGLFEVFVHGWDHVDYSQMNLTEQTSTLQQANNKMNTLFGSSSTVFVPPYDVFNENTLVAMKQLGFKIISPAEWAGNYPSFVADGHSTITDNYGIYHMPESVGFVEFNNGTSTRVSNGQILDVINSKIASQGYAVVTLHAQDFRQQVNGIPVDVLNQTEVQDLNSLIDSVLAKNYHIRTFNQVVQFKQSPPTMPVKLGDVKKIGVTAQTKAIQDLISLVDGMPLKKGVTENLEQKLKEVVKDLAKNNLKEAKNDLKDFADEVKQQKGRSLTMVQADKLTSAIQAIMAMLP